jgi:hypothetical protein
MKELVSKKATSKKDVKKDGFKRHSVLVDSKRKTVIRALLTKKKQKKSKAVVKVDDVSLSANPYSKIKNLPHDLQNQLADNIYSVYMENDSRARNNSNAAWGAGLFIPAAIETVGFVAGFNFDIPTAILANVIFAAIFRFSVGDSMVKPRQEMANKKAKQAAHLLNSGKINSEYAQTKLVGIVPISDAYSILEGDHLKSEEAQLQLVDRASHVFNSTQLSRLLRNSVIKGRARNVLSNLAGRT